MASELISNKATSIIESQILAKARSDAGIYGQRLLVRLVEMTQKYVRGDNFDQVINKERIEVGLWGDALIRFRVNSILSGEDDNNYSKAKKAINALMDSKLTFEDEDVYETTHILGSAKIYKKPGIMEIKVMSTVWQAMLDFTKGFVQYDPDVAVRLTSEYSLILYKQLRNQSKPLTYSFEKLREKFHIEDKYKKNADIVDKVLKPAKEELDAISSISFSYQLVYSTDPKDGSSPRRGRKACTGVTITPVHLTKNDKTEALIREISPGMLLGRELTDLLKNKFDFNYGGIKANLPLFDTAVKQMGENGYLDWIAGIAPAALRTDSPAGYLINATKKMLREKYNVNLREDKPAIVSTTSLPNPKKISNSLRNEGPLGGLFANILEGTE
jgi:Protein involved in initiation of plasmid replication